MNRAARAHRRLALVQGSYYVLTGLWPLVHYASFELVTGPKSDDWLVRTTGLLIAAVGANLLLAARSRPSHISATTGLAAGLALGGPGAWYAAKGTVPPIYLIDATLELGFVVAWVAFLTRGRRA